MSVGRRRTWLACAALALVLHGLLLSALRDVWAPWRAASPTLPRLQAAYTRELTLEAAPAAAARSKARTTANAVSAAAAPRPATPASDPVMPPTAQQVADAASAASHRAGTESPGSPVEGSVEGATSEAHPVAAVSPAAAGGPAMAAAASAPAGAASREPFEWPRATRVHYRLIGQYRGEVQGRASVEWLRQDERYQVHLDVSVAGVFTRRMSSEGRITPAGLQPQRYQQVTEILGNLFTRPRVEDMRFGGDSIRLVNGQEVPALPMVQDTASQFIQFIYLLTTEPALRETGRTVDLALALPRSARVWRYEAAPPDAVDTPAGRVETLHMRPASGSAQGDWTVEIWFAPRLQMLPVRFRLRQSDEVYFDLFIDRMPEQAER